MVQLVINLSKEEIKCSNKETMNEILIDIIALTETMVTIK
jgi:hypothetical protein